MRVWLALLTTAGCSAPSLRVAVDPPATIDRVGAVLLDARGVPFGGTGLLPRDQGLQSQLAALTSSADEIATVLLVGYSDDELALANGGAIPSPEVLARSPLHLARPEEPVLPQPSWQNEGPLQGGEARLGSSSRTTELSASWLPPCPTLLPESAQVKVSACSGFYCGANFTQAGCTLLMELNACIAGAPEQLQVSARGEVSGSSADYQCSPAPTRPGANFSFVCEPRTMDEVCPVDVLVGPYTAPFLVSPPIQVVSGINPTERPVAVAAPNFGYVLDAVPLPPAQTDCPYPGRRVVVLTRSEATRCDGENRLVVVDAESLAVLGEVPWTGSCAARLDPDPSSDGLLLLAEEPLEIARLGCDLAVIGERIPIRAEVPNTHEAMDATLVERSTAPTEWWLGFGRENVEAPPEPGWLVRVNPADLTQQRLLALGTYPVGGIQVGFGFDRLLAPLSTDRVLAALSTLDNNVFQVGTFDLLIDPPSLQISSAKFGAKLPTRANALAGLPRRRQIMASSVPGKTDPRPSVLRVGSPAAMLEQDFLDFTAPDRDLTGAIVWPAAPSRAEFDDYALVVSSARWDATAEARIGLVNLGLGRLEPGRVRIGYGPSGRMRADDLGDVWVPLPWHGAIVRVRPSPPVEVSP
ncbi:MAG: hypothetical protein IPG45_29130 [Deltaproteobacteria bacterium]|nr:hypothetical protein [Deltaproteobacteria bacterium]